MLIAAAEPWLGADLELHQDTGEVSAAPCQGEICGCCTAVILRSWSRSSSMSKLNFQN